MQDIQDLLDGLTRVEADEIAYNRADFWFSPVQEMFHGLNDEELEALVHQEVNGGKPFEAGEGWVVIDVDDALAYAREVRDAAEHAERQGLEMLTPTAQQLAQALTTLPGHQIARAHSLGHSRLMINAVWHDQAISFVAHVTEVLDGELPEPPRFILTLVRTEPLSWAACVTHCGWPEARCF
ncbi:hypothetical protein ACFSC4_28685 [Deinococcus malanensis]|uniref:hypothetical protein n=1 Tax=Deinococcus malanensis TaxID=1706855 RepID=UPI003631D0E9